MTPRILIDLDDSIVDKVEKLANQERRKRKAMIELIIERHFQE